MRKVLRRLVEQGVVADARVGQAVSYRLNRRHVAAAHIVGIAGLFDELPAHFRDQLDALAENATAWTGNDTRVLELSATEVRLGLGDGEPMYGDILREGIRLHGPGDYLRRARIAATSP